MLIKLRDIIYIPIASFFMWIHSFIVNSTLKITLSRKEIIEEVHSKGQQAIYAFWHQATFSMFYYYRGKKNCVMPVDNYLGSILAKFVKKYGCKVVRYPQNGKPVERVRAISKIIKVIKSGYDCSIAVDGPPDEEPFKAKPGVFYLAQRTGFPVIPIGVHYSKSSVINFRWDKYLIPKLFAKTILLAGNPIYVKKGISENDLDKMCRSLENELHKLTREAKEICTTKKQLPHN